MSQPFSKTIEDDFIDEEDIIAKFQYLENVTERYPYRPLSNSAAYSFSDRVGNAMTKLPEEHKRAALALFANTIYIPDPILDEAWREATYSIRKKLNGKSTVNFLDSLYLAVDNDGLINIFSGVANIEGREDHNLNPGFNSVSGIINELFTLIESKKQSPDLQKIITMMKKKNWIILSDNSISGGSLASDIKKLMKIRSILYPKGETAPFLQKDTQPPQIYAVVQLITEQALLTLDEVLPKTNIAYGLEFDEGMRISSGRCSLFNKDSTREAVRKLCEWFGNNFFLDQHNPNFRARIREHVQKGGQDNYAFGWKNCGYTIVTQNNALSNSVPVIYHRPPSVEGVSSDENRGAAYEPPFPRIESRIYHEISPDSSRLGIIEEWKNIDYLQTCLYRNK